MYFLPPDTAQSKYWSTRSWNNVTRDIEMAQNLPVDSWLTNMVYDHSVPCYYCGTQSKHGDQGNVKFRIDLEFGGEYCYDVESVDVIPEGLEVIGTMDSRENLTIGGKLMVD